MENMIIPKKLKMIGKPTNDKNTRIYISKDVHKKVYNYSKTVKDVQIAGVYLGYVLNSDGIDNIIILKFLEAKETKSTDNSINFTKASWKRIDEEKKKNPDIQMVGWMRTSIGKGVVTNKEDLYFQSHIFSKKNSMFHIVDPVSVVETYYYFENGGLKKVSGFFVFDDTQEELLTSKGSDENEEVIELFVDGGVKVENRKEIFKPTFGVEPEEEIREDVVYKNQEDTENSDVIKQTDEEQPISKQESEISEIESDENSDKEDAEQVASKKENKAYKANNLLLSILIAVIIGFVVVTGILVMVITGMNNRIKQIESEFDDVKSNISRLYDNDMKIGNHIGLEEEAEEETEKETEEKTEKESEKDTEEATEEMSEESAE